MSERMSALKAEDAYLLQNYGDRDTDLVRGQGIWAWDSNGNKYLDCVSGIAVNAFGHCFPPAVEAMRRQAGELVHGSNLFLLKPQLELARVLVEHTHLAKAFFCNSGTEANEGAVKFARKYWNHAGAPERMTIAYLAGSFHGRTYGAMSATGQAKIRNGFGPLLADFVEVPANDAAALLALDREKLAAVLFEPVLAEGGILSLTPDFVAALKQLQAAGVLLACDEIQTGIGRCGEILGEYAYGLKADIVTLAKPIGAGLPLGAVLVSAPVAAAIAAGDHGSTFGGNPVACAGGLEVVKAVFAPGFLPDLQTRSAAFRARLEDFAARHGSKGFSGPVLGMGFLLGIHYSGDLAALLKKCRQAGLLVHRAGKDVVRFLPPLNITAEETGMVFDLLEGVAATL